MARGTSNGNSSGSSCDRRSRHAFLVAKHGSKSGRTVRCFWCRRWVRVVEFHVDRYPLCGHLGGRYTRDNIVPGCYKCNSGRCGSGGKKCAGAYTVWTHPSVLVPALAELDMNAPPGDREEAKRRAEQMRERIRERLKPYEQERVK